MTNLFIILLVGASLGWTVSALHARFSSFEAVANVILGALAGFAGALIANGGTLYSGLSVQTYGGCIAAALLTLGLSQFIRSRLSR